MVHVPVVRRKPWGIICLVMSIIPGVGTMMAASNQENVRWFWSGLAQLVLSLTIVGAAIGVPWSIISGVLIFVKSE
jgi:hypothetical protein